MKKGKKGFVVSAVLYPLLVLFLAIIMGLLSMTDTRKRILDKMKLEITDNIFDDAACSCDTILAKLNYIIANGTGGSGGDTGSYAYNKLTLNVKTYEAYSDFPVVGNIIGDIAVLSDTPIKNYYVSTSVPKSPQEGTVWIVQDNTSNYYVTSDWNRIGISYVMQYENSKWVLKKSYVYNGESWTMLYYVNLKNGYVDLTKSDINAEITKTYDYTGEYQTFKAVFSGYYKIELWGAQGGTYSQPGGKGAYTSGEIYLSAGESIYIYIGGTTTSTTGGWNGGGNGYTNGRGGGGATDVRLVSTTTKNIWNEFESLKSRIMVAAGGGGGQYYNGDYYGAGGAGGTLTGGDGSTKTHYPGIGATQSTGGYRSDNYNISTGGFGYGAAALDHQYGEGGGGGGYYGGGGGYIAGGSGGSSYISGYEGCSSIEEASDEKNIIHNGSSYHYSGKYFREATMTSGNNSGNGHAKITLVTVEEKSKNDIKSIRDNNPLSRNYNFSGTTKINGRYQVFDVEYSGYYKIELWGAQGGTYSQPGGKGAYTSGQIYLTKGSKFYIYVGGSTSNQTGGWNGGGSSYLQYDRGGGGATDIRYVNTTSITTWNEFESLKTRIMVAAGGGGGQYYSSDYYGAGGAGGTLNGVNGSTKTHSVGTGASQSRPGVRSDNGEVSAGGFGYGNNSLSSVGHVYGNGAGGGGYYGGGSGFIGGGGGGSSYISGYEGCSSIEEESTALNIIHNGSAYHYSGYYFDGTTMISGNEANMPTHDGTSTMTGNSGEGYAKITLISKKDNESTTADDNVSKWNYMYSGANLNNGRYQVFKANKTGIYKIELWGAQGGTYSQPGGKGAYTSGQIYLTKGSKFYIYVGGTTYTSVKGWNGGGNGNTAYGRGGGGATDIRINSSSALTSWNEFSSLKTRIMVAAGGGGGQYYNGDYYGNGGAGGDLNGINGYSRSHQPGLGATQTLPGYRSDSYTTNVGGFGYGAISGDHQYGEGGGGGGYYGGGGGFIGGGGGGSSYISGYEGCNSIADVSEETSILHNGSAYHYSGYYFKNVSMISGIESTMPSHYSGGTTTGNSGEGSARITFIEEKNVSENEMSNYIIENEKKWQYSFAGTNNLDGSYQIFKANKTGIYKIELWGAQGGTYSQPGGKGAYTSGEITLTKGNSLYIYVGGTSISQAGGWNGGGNSSTAYDRGGGGATDVRTTQTTSLKLWNNIDSLKSRIMIAAGGGAGQYYNGDYYGAGGAGGGLTGINGGSRTHYFGKGATQISGGSRSDSATTYVGSFGSGASTTTGQHAYGNGAGGGGYYGGGGGWIGGGGGGSSYISGHAGCIGVNSSGNPLATEYSVLSDSISYTGYKFTNTMMIDGTGYPWTTVKSSASSGMPSPTSGSTQTGQSGNGYAKITYLGA